MADTFARTHKSSSSGWFCCVRPAVVVEEEETAGAAAAMSHTKANGTHSTHVTATAHTGDVRDAAPTGRDQGSAKHAAEPGPASAAAAGSIAAVMAAKMNSHNKPDQGPVVRATHTDLKHLMASAHDRQYTDADWDACLEALEAVKQQNHALALSQLQNGQQLRAGAAANGGLHRSSFTSAGSDVWHDAFSHTMSDASGVGEAEHREIEQYLQELEMLRGPAPSPELTCTPSCVPNPPLLFAPSHWKYCQVDVRPFCAYWERDYTRSTNFPLPIDKQQKLNKLAMMCHESIPGTWLRMEGKQLVLTASPTLVALPGIVNYNEYFNTDSTLTTWHLRRDISIGRSQGQMFMTTDGILIFRVFCIGMFGKTADCVLEDYMRVEDNGNVIVTRQYSKLMSDKSEASQYLIGRRKGTAPPSKHAAHKH